MNRMSFKFASRPVRIAVAMKFAFLILGANASLAAAKVLWTKGQETSAHTPVVARIVPIEAVAVATVEPAKDVCRQVEVETDDGYGMRGHVTRWVCRKAL